MFGKQLAVCGALEGLEAGLALDGLGGGVLQQISMRVSRGSFGRQACAAKRVVRISTATWPPWDRQRPCGRASAVLYSLVSVALLACTGHGRTLLRCPWC